MRKCCQKILGYLGCGKKEPYFNKYPIDDYIDEYWIKNCPNSRSRVDINDAIKNLLHRLYYL